MKRFPVLLFLILVFNLTSNAQQFGAFPHSTHWKQINTDTVRIIFTNGAEEQAARIATLIHKAAADTSFSLGNRLRKVNILLQSRTTLANGYVALAPFRSEFYLIPNSNVFDFGNLSWPDNLAVHEYRHVQQYNNFRHGLSKGFYYIFGERGLAFANAITIPDWFFEGDAVHSETALTPQGRGRLSYFLSGYNSLWLEGRNYSWQKLRNGSLKDYVPNHYQLGYLLANYGYLKYGDDFWKKVTNDASAFKGLFYPFQKAVKKYSGVDYKTFRKEAFAYYKERLKYQSRKKLSQKTVTDHFFPQYIGSDSLLYLKSAYNRNTAFYIKDGKNEKRLGQRSIGSEDWMSYRNGKIVYTAYSTHPRWGLIDYNDIVVRDLGTGSEKRLTKKSKYYTPDFSPSAEKIIAVRITDSLHSNLEILNSSNGNIIQSITPEDEQYYTNPRFISENKFLTGVRNNLAQMSLQQYDLITGKWEVLIPYSFHSISLPSVKEDTVFFTANFYGNDDVFAMDLSNKKLFQLTRRFTGTYYPTSSGNSLAFSFFTSNGLALEEMDMNKALWTEVDPAVFKQPQMIYPIAHEKNLLPVQKERFRVKRYSRATGIFNFHSWSPNFSDPEFTFSIYGDNVLNSFSNEIFYRYNQNENSHGVGWNASYGAFFPMINFGVEYTFDRHIPITVPELTLNQFEARLGYNIPLNFTRKKTFKYLNFGSDLVYNRIQPTGIFKDSLEARQRTYLHHFLSWSHFLPRAVQHIYPRFGYTFSGHLRHWTNIADGGLNHNAQWLLNAQLFLPSIKNHSIVLSGAYQRVDSNSTMFSNRFAGSRGYDDYYFRTMWRLSGNYHFPIIYPDLGLASIVYFQRLRGNVFYDYTRVFSGYFGGNAPLQSRNLRSVGGEIYFDTRWWNQQPVSFGFRVSHLLDNGFTSQDRKGVNWFEFILPVNLIPN